MEIDGMYAALRLIHNMFGAFWFGATLMFIGFIGPANREAGQRLTRELLRAAVNWSAVLTVLSGLALYWRDSGGLQLLAWITSPVGWAFGVGGVAGVVALVLRLGISWPTDRELSARRAAARTDGTPPAAEGPPPALAALLARQRWAGRVTAALLAISLALMSIARAL